MVRRGYDTIRLTTSSSQMTEQKRFNLLTVVRLTPLFYLTLLALETVVVSAAPVNSPPALPTAEQTMYLMKFGYLPMTESKTVQELRSSNEVRQAVLKFQRMAGLTQTGRLDEATAEMMTRTRCGVPDTTSGLPTEVNEDDTSGGPQNFEVSSHKWQKTDLTYRILNHPSNVDLESTRSALRRALLLWSEKSVLTFRDSSHDNAVQSGGGDIDITFASRYHNDGYEFDGRGGVLAHAFPPGGGRGGDVHFDNEETWTGLLRPSSGDGTSIFSVAAHEFGHSLGIRHSRVPTALMYPWYNQHNPIQQLDDDDIKALQQLYGRSTGDKRPTYRPTTSTRQPPVATSSHRPVALPRSTSSSWRPDDGRTCSSRFDTITTIDRLVHVFFGRKVVILSSSGRQSETTVTSLWPRLPARVTSIDAIYQRAHDRVVVIFKGSHYWEFRDSELMPGFPERGRPIHNFGLPADVKKVQAAFVGLGSTNRRTYLVREHAYWGLKDLDQKVDYGYPRDMAFLRGVPVPIDAAFTDTDGKTYFFQGDKYWLFNATKLEVANGYPRPVSERWDVCGTQNLRKMSTGGATAALMKRGNTDFLAFILVSLTSLLLIHLST